MGRVALSREPPQHAINFRDGDMGSSYCRVGWREEEREVGRQEAVRRQEGNDPPVDRSGPRAAPDQAPATA